MLQMDPVLLILCSSSQTSPSILNTTAKTHVSLSNKPERNITTKPVEHYLDLL